MKTKLAHLCVQEGIDRKETVMDSITSHFRRLFCQAWEHFSRIFFRGQSDKEASIHMCVNQVNAFISFLPEEERRLLPTFLVSHFAEEADQPPEKALDPRKTLAEQSFSAETLLLLTYINMILKEALQLENPTDDELHASHIRATEGFIRFLNAGAPGNAFFEGDV